MSEFRIDQIKSQDATRGPDIAGISTFTGTSAIVMPSGNTDYRGARGRGIIYAGYAPSHVLNIDMINIASTGNAVQFGSDPTPSMQMGANSSTVRMVFGGGSTPSSTQCRYVEIAHTGKSMVFADLTVTRRGTGTTGDSVRGIFGGGAPDGTEKVIDYITYTNQADAVDFGNLSLGRRQLGATGNTTRGVFCGGYLLASPYLRYNVMDYVTIASTGDAVDFGDITTTIKGAVGAGGNGIRGFIPGGNTTNSSTDTNTIDSFSPASLGNTLDFGDLTVTLHNVGVCPNKTRAVFCGGYAPGTNVMSYVQISTIGNAIDFGDLTAARSAGNDGANSDSHGGLE